MSFYFNENGKFRILFLTDIHNRLALRTATEMFLKKSVRESKPDLIILGGDTITGPSFETEAAAEKSIRRVMDVFEPLGVPVAMVFGNHDSEKISKEFRFSVYKSYSCFVGEKGEKMTGLCNFNIPIFSSDRKKVAFNLFLVDSLTYNYEKPTIKDTYKENELGGYACVHKDRIEWYEKTALSLKEKNGGNVVPSFVFRHMIVPEIFEIAKKVGVKSWALPDGTKGEINEKPCPPNYNNGEFDAMKKTGDVLAMFFGHDHVNFFETKFKGIDLVNTTAAGFYTYGDKNRGGRIIDIFEENPFEYKTEMLFWRDVFETEKKPIFKYIYTLNERKTPFLKKLFNLLKYAISKPFSDEDVVLKFSDLKKY